MCLALQNYPIPLCFGGGFFFPVDDKWVFVVFFSHGFCDRLISFL